MSSARAAAVALLAAVLAGCSPGGKTPIRLPFKLPGLAGPGFDKDALESAIDGSFGGVGTCVVIDDTRTGLEVFRYNAPSVCMRRLPPCATFDIASDLIGLDAGVVTPGTVFPWDHSPQPIAAWRQDADMRTAFRDSIEWWRQTLARKIGQAAYRDRLKAFGYGNASPDGPIASFWQGPAAGGALAISTDEQAAFLHRLYTDELPAAPANQAYVRRMMLDETRGGSTISGEDATCASAADGSRQVAWWVGRLQTPRADYVFAASLESPNDTSLPGEEIRHRFKTVFTQVGLWPPPS